MTKTNTKAFTLIELLIVIVIIGILAVALIPRLTGAQASARDTARKATLQQVSTIFSSYIGQSNPTAIVAGGFGNSGVALGTTTQTALSGYGNLPIDAAGNPIFVVAKNSNTYGFCVALENGNGNVANCLAANVNSGTTAGASFSTGYGYLVTIAQ